MTASARARQVSSRASASATALACRRTSRFCRVHHLPAPPRLLAPHAPRGVFRPHCSLSRDLCMCLPPLRAPRTRLSCPTRPTARSSISHRHPGAADADASVTRTLARPQAVVTLLGPRRAMSHARRSPPPTARASTASKRLLSGSLAARSSPSNSSTASTRSSSSRTRTCTAATAARARRSPSTSLRRRSR